MTATIIKVVPLEKKQQRRFEIIATGACYLIWIVDHIDCVKYHVKTDGKDYSKMLKWTDAQWLNWINKNTPSTYPPSQT